MSYIKRQRKKMKVEDLISEYIPPLKYTETGEKALNWMNEFRVSHLPVLQGNEYVGLVSDDDIYDMVDPKNMLKDEFVNLIIRIFFIKI